MRVPLLEDRFPGDHGVGCQKSSEVVPSPDLAMLGLLPRRPWSRTIPP
jgi:hypothetical protein